MGCLTIFLISRSCDPNVATYWITSNTALSCCYCQDPQFEATPTWANFFSFLGVGWDWVYLACWPLTDLVYQPWMIDDDEWGAVSGMRTGRGNRSTWRKPAPVPLCPPQIPYDLTWAQTWAAAVGSWHGPHMSLRFRSNCLCTCATKLYALYICM
jgi:hypothetical protein